MPDPQVVYRNMDLDGPVRIIHSRIWLAFRNRLSQKLTQRLPTIFGMEFKELVLEHLGPLYEHSGSRRFCVRLCLWPCPRPSTCLRLFVEWIHMDATGS